jgi:cytochrome c oxidase cbb3-type subunit 2
MRLKPAGLALLLLASSARAEDVEDPLVLGERVYRKACEPCHGPEGDGTGPQARWLDPLPRDFTLGTFKFRSTMSGAIPTDEDLRRTVDRGVPGTAMPSWRHLLSVRERDAVVAYIKTFSDWFDDGVYPEDIVVTVEQLEAPPTVTEEMLVAGREVYARMECAKCHGEDGRGNRDNPLEDDYGRSIVAFDFTTGLYKAGSSPPDVYRSFATGLDSTPMPSYADSLDEAERWQLVYYCLALSRQPTLRDWLLDPPIWNHRIVR